MSVGVAVGVAAGTKAISVVSLDSDSMKSSEPSREVDHGWRQLPKSGSCIKQLHGSKNSKSVQLRAKSTESCCDAAGSYRAR